MEGQVLGSYQIIRELGKGGMGVVYLAQHAVLGRQAAIKLLHAELSANDEVVQRFFNEARMTALIKHPGLVDVYDFGRLNDGRAYLVMEYLEGEPLSATIAREGRLPMEVAVGLLRQLAGAVGAAHARGIVHRDLKPDNVMVVRDDETDIGVRARVLDFGIAKLAPGMGAESLHTRTGSLLGTPVYMSPEQCRGTGTVDWRSDIYALGCILFEMLTGRRVFDATGMGEVIGAHLHTPPRKPSELHPPVPRWLDAVVLRALAKAPESRFQSLDELSKALGGGKRKSTLNPVSQTGIVVGRESSTFSRTVGEVLVAVPPQRRRRALAAIGAAAVACAATLGILIARNGTPGTAPPRAPFAAAPVVSAPVETIAPARAAPPLPLPSTAMPAEPPPPAAATPPPVAPAPAPSPPPPEAPAAPTTLARGTLRSEPPGAEVISVATGARLGVTPYTPAPDDRGELVLELRLKGYSRARVTVAAGETLPERDVKLRKAVASSPRPPHDGPPSTVDPF